MAIATITPPNPVNTNVLAQALSQGTASLQAALNAAIQRGAQDVANQMQQEQALMTQNERNIANERAERFDLRNRAQWLAEFNRNQGNDTVRNDIAQSDLALRQQSGERADTLFGFQQADRNRAEQLGVTAPELAARQEERTTTTFNEALIDRSRAQAQGVDPVSSAVEAQKIARMRAETERRNADARSFTQQSTEAQTTRFDAAANEIVNRVNDPAQFEAMTNEDIQASLSILGNSSTTASPEIEQVRVRLAARLPQQSTTRNLPPGTAFNAEVRNAEQNAELRALQIQADDESLPEEQRADARRRAQQLAQQLRLTNSVLDRYGLPSSTTSSGNATFRFNPTSDR